MEPEIGIIVMRIFFILLALGLSVPCGAQKNLVQQAVGKGMAGEILGKNAGQQILRHARVVQGKIMLEGALPKVPFDVNVEKYIFKKVMPTNVKNLPILLFSPSYKQEVQIALLYRKVINSFKTFKKEMDVFLYYQLQLNERRQISAAEQAVWSKKIGEMNAQLAQLRNLISEEEPFYKAAREYMTFAAETINPMLRGILEKRDFIRVDRQYVPEEFFLHAPDQKKESSWKKWIPSSMQNYQAARRLPKHLKLAVLNDRRSVLQAFQSAHKYSFCPNWGLTTYENAEDLLRDISNGKEFDIILTDIVVAGGGGYYLVSTLRAQEFKGVIIGLSAYEEEPKMGLKMFNRGFDGMIPLWIGFENDTGWWPREIMTRLQNYFYYRDMNGWSR